MMESFANYKSPEIKIGNNLQELAEILGKFLSKQFLQAKREHKNFNIALSGGSTPLKLFGLLANKPLFQSDLDFLHFFWGDERCVPPDDSQSNFGQMFENFIRKIPVPAQNVHRIKGENDPVEESRRYSELLINLLLLNNKLPQFDLVLLGLGEDGHTASIFPHEAWKISTDEICFTATHPESGQKRITLSMEVINNSLNVIFLITGKSKSDIVKRIVKEGDAFKFPAGYVDPVSGNLSWYLDAEAASGLK